MEPMVNKRLYTLVLKKYNGYGDTPDERKYTYTNLEYAVCDGLRKVLRTYIKVNNIDPDKFVDFYDRTYEECINTYTFTVSLGVDDGDEYYLEAYIETGPIVDGEFPEEFLEDYLKIKARWFEQKDFESKQN